MRKQEEILICGGSGSLGNALVRLLKKKYDPHGIRIYSRGEYLQWQMARALSDEGINDNIAFLIGDIRDKERLNLAMKNVDVVINCAALKHVPAAEFNPFEACKTNIEGAQNIIECAIQNNVHKVMHISTDKAIEPINLYGMTKGVAEKMFIHGNSYTGGRAPRMSCCRYGNVIASRGSVIELFREQAKNGVVNITDERMTRFWITLDQVAQFIVDNVKAMKGQEIFIPKMPSMNIMDLKAVVAPDADIKIIGIRQGEKLHEKMISNHETIYLKEEKNHYVLDYKTKGAGSDWEYASNTNEWKLSKKELKEMI